MDSIYKSNLYSPDAVSLKRLISGGKKFACLVLLGFPGVVFLGGDSGNKMLVRTAFAQEEQSLSCAKLTAPKNIQEVKELLVCLQRVRSERKAQKRAQIILKSYEGSVALSELLGSAIRKESAIWIPQEAKIYPASVKLTEQIKNKKKPPATEPEPKE